MREAVQWIWIGAAILAAAYVVTHWQPLVRLQRRGAWRLVSRGSNVSGGLAGRATRAGNWIGLAVAGLVNRWTATPLHIEPLSSQAEEIDGTVVAEVLRSTITQIATLGPTRPSMVATPFAARPLLNEVAEAVSTVPQGRFIAPLISLLGRALRRDELVLRGGALLSDKRGPGLSLSVSRTNGELVDSLTVWADEYEPRHTRNEEDRADVTGRMMRVATAAAVWTHFTVLRFRLALPDEEYRSELGTPSWQSFAFLRAGARERVALKFEAQARALFALAADTDPQNLAARFNLAQMESMDREEGVAAERLQLIHSELADANSTAKTADELLSDRETVDRDPFQYQVMSMWASAALNRFFRVTDESEEELDDAGEKALGDLEEVWRELTRELVHLEAALAILGDDGKLAEPTGQRCTASSRRTRPWLRMNRARKRRRWRWKHGMPSRSDSEQLVLAGFLERIEPPMLMRWAMMGLVIGQKTGNTVLTAPTQNGATLDRMALCRHLDAWARDRGFLKPDAVVVHFLKKRAILEGNTRYELACYYAQNGDDSRALEELHQSFELGEHRITWADGDPQLEAVAATPEYRALVDRYSDRS